MQSNTAHYVSKVSGWWLLLEAATCRTITGIRKTMAVNMILGYPDKLLRLSLSFLGIGHFTSIALVCSRFKIAYLANVSDEMITTGESVTSSILRAEKYFEDACTSEQLRYFWCSVARYGRVDVIEWAHRQGYSRIWNERFFHWNNCECQVCMKAAGYGQLAALQWL